MALFSATKTQIYMSQFLEVNSYLAGDVPAWWTTNQGGSPTLSITTCTGGDDSVLHQN